MAEGQDRSLAWCVDTILRRHFEAEGTLQPHTAKPKSVA